MKKLRILVANWRDIKHPDAGGAEVYVHNICTEFVKMGHEVSIYSSAFPNSEKQEIIDGIRIVRGGGKLSVYWYVFKQYLKERKKFDAVLESVNTIPFFLPLYASKPTVGIIYSINNKKALLSELGITPISLAAWLFSSILPLFYRKKVSVTISETSKKELIDAGFASHKVFVAKPGLNNQFEQLSEKAPIVPRPNARIISLGRLKKYKGIDDILNALALLHNQLELELLIVGKGDYEQKLRDHVAELGLEKCVTFAGFLNEEEKVSALKSSSLFISCSVDEGGWIISGLEALRCGVPLLVTSSQSDMVQDGITGFVVPYNKPYVLAEKILLVLQGNWEQMSVAASNWAKIYTWEYTAKETLAAINFAIA